MNLKYWADGMPAGLSVMAVRSFGRTDSCFPAGRIRTLCSGQLDVISTQNLYVAEICT